MTIDWVKEVLIVWGLSKRRIDFGGIEYKRTDGERKWHWDGWPPRSIQGKSKDEGEGASHTADGQHYPEVLVGDALLVARALYGAPEQLRDLAYVHYVVPKQLASVKEKQFELGYKNGKAYYDNLSRLHLWISARWDVPHGTRNGERLTTNYLTQT